MKRILSLLIDLLLILGGIVSAFYLLESTGSLQDFQRNFDAFKIVTPFIMILYLILNYAFASYNLTRSNLFEIIYTTFLISLSLMIGIMGICFFLRDIALAFPRSVILLSAFFYFVLLSLWHIILWAFSKKTHGVKEVLVIGEDCNDLIQVIENKYAPFYHIKDICSSDEKDFSSKIKTVDEVFICSDIATEHREDIFRFCFQYDKEIFYVPKPFDLNIMTSLFQKIDDIPVFRMSTMELSLEEKFVKRLFDLLFGSIAALICLPLGLLVAIIVRLDGGPVFYAQERVTRDGKIFKILKFRTMIPDAEKHTGPVLAGDNDPRITKVGQFMRAVRLDEIPQLWNILNGDMSIVGPRPERPFFVEQFEKEFHEYRYRLRVKAGLTGLAQVEGKYNTTVENKLRYDLIYITDYSILKDFLIMLQTVKILFMKSSTEGVNQK